MSGMGETLVQQDLIAARVKLIEGQIEGFKPIQTDITAYGETVEKARAMGNTLKEESDEEEKVKIDKRLEEMATQFSELQQSAIDRMKGTVHAIACLCSSEVDKRFVVKLHEVYVPCVLSNSNDMQD